MTIREYVDLLVKVTAAGSGQLVLPNPKFKMTGQDENGLEFDTEREHGTGVCKCCTPPNIVQKHEEIWKQKWKAISKQRRIERKQQRLSGEGNWQDKRWFHEYQEFENLRWSFY